MTQEQKLDIDILDEIKMSVRHPDVGEFCYSAHPRHLYIVTEMLGPSDSFPMGKPEIATGNMRDYIAALSRLLGEKIHLDKVGFQSLEEENEFEYGPFAMIIRVSEGQAMSMAKIISDFQDEINSESK